MWKRLPDLSISVVNHQSILMGDTVYLFGGYKNSIQPLHEKISIYRLSPDKYCEKIEYIKTYEWDCNSSKTQRLTESEVEPLDCYGHTVVSWRGIGLLFGGCSREGCCPATVYMFVRHGHMLWPDAQEGEEEEETWLKVTGIGGSAPASRDGHSVVVHRDCMFMYGGLVSDTRMYDNKLYQLDLVRWQWIVLNNGDRLEPLGRDFCSLAVHESVLYMFGGRSDNGSQQITHTDIYDTAMWSHQLGRDAASGSWTKVHPGAGIVADSYKVHSNQAHLTPHHYLHDDQHPIPLPRRSHMSMMLGDELVVLGGLYETADFSVHLCDVWSFSVPGRRWRCLQPSTTQTAIEGGPSMGPTRKAAVCRLNEHTLLITGGVTAVGSTMVEGPSKYSSEDWLVTANCCQLQEGAASDRQPTVLGSYGDATTTSILSSRFRVRLIDPHATWFAGSCTTVTDLDIHSIRQAYILLPRLTLYEKALSKVIDSYHVNQLSSAHLPLNIWQDILSISNFL